MLGFDVEGKLAVRFVVPPVVAHQHRADVRLVHRRQRLPRPLVDVVHPHVEPMVPRLHGLFLISVVYLWVRSGAHTAPANGLRPRLASCCRHVAAVRAHGAKSARQMGGTGAGGQPQLGGQPVLRLGHLQVWLRCE